MPSTDPRFDFSIFADCHLPIDAGNPEFLSFVDTFKHVASQSRTVVLLGDLFRIWTGTPGFDHANGRLMLKTVEEVSSMSAVVFVEGNWDFYVRRVFGKTFQKVSEHALELQSDRWPSIVVTHGHLNHSFVDRLLIGLLKSTCAFHLFKTPPFRRLAYRLNRTFEGGEFSKSVPKAELASVAEKLSARYPHARHIFCGHFHVPYRLKNVTIIPDYYATHTFLGIDDDIALYRVNETGIEPATDIAWETSLKS